MRLLSLSLILFLCISTTAFAETKEAQSIERYLNNLKTLQSRFVQTSHDGRQLSGTFYLNRPGKLRFEYDLPLKDFIVADGTFIYFYDGELEQQSNTTIGNSLASFLLRKNVKLSGDIVVTDIKKKAGLLQVTLSQSDDLDAGSLLLGFTPSPLQLKKWRVTDSQGYITEVELSEVKRGIRLDKKLFRYIDPNKKSDNYFND